MNNLKLSEINKLNADGVITAGGAAVTVGARVRFSTRCVYADGIVLGIDHGDTYPIKLEYYREGDKHVTTFHPDEFFSFELI